MSTLTVQLEDEQMTSLRKEADRLGVPVEQLARMILHRHVAPRGQAEGGAKFQPVSEEVFREALEASARENDELYRRLAR